LSAGLASFVAGLILTEGLNGELLNYNIVGYIAIILSILCIPLARRIKVIDTDEPLVSLKEKSEIEV
jgi:hypothetical protein